MLASIILTGSLPLVTVDIDDSRLTANDTFVSRKAELVLSSDDEGDVLCLDRPRDGSICLAREEWNKAVTMANAQPQLRNMYRIVNMQHTFSNMTASIGSR